MAAPPLFGLQNFTQWGGMYTNNWCTVQLGDSNPIDNPAAKTEDVLAGKVTTRYVWSYPMHNATSCLVWGRKYCGRTATAGWTVTWVRPYFKGTYYMDPNNACDLPLPVSYSTWFPDVVQH